MGLRYFVAFLSHMFSLMYMNFSIFCMSTYIHLYWYRDEQYVYIYIYGHILHTQSCIYICIKMCIYNIHIFLLLLLLLKPLFAIAEICISPEQKNLLQLPFQLLGKFSISFDKYSNFLSIRSFIWCLLKSPFAL